MQLEIVNGLTKQGFLVAQGKNIVPTETGLSLFGVLKQADRALVVKIFPMMTYGAIPLWWR